VSDRLCTVCGKKADDGELCEFCVQERKRLAAYEQDGRDLIVFADGVEEAGHRVYAQRARSVADHLLRVVDELQAERSARRSIQKQCDAFKRLAAKYAAGEEPGA
jgi:hypothetical protein